MRDMTDKVTEATIEHVWELQAEVSKLREQLALRGRAFELACETIGSAGECPKVFDINLPNCPECEETKCADKCWQEYLLQQAALDIANNIQPSLIVEDLLVHELHYQDGQIDMKIGGEAAMQFITAIVEFFKQNGGQNYLTFAVAGQGEEYAITIQNLKGELTPAAKIEQLEKIAEAARTVAITEPGNPARGKAIANLRDVLITAGYGEFKRCEF